MRLLVFGRTGQVGTELARIAPTATYLGRDAADLSDPPACAAVIAAHRPDAVINAAAWTAVDRAEAAEAEAHVVNGDAPAAMAATCARLGVPFVQISTDYVFDGAGHAPFTPDSPTGPLSAYGRTKLAGEQGVRASGAPHAILRTSWIFSAHGNNFVKTMLRLSDSRDRLTVVADQTGAPTPAAGIARVCLAAATRLIADPSVSGTYHVAGAPDTTWADFARAIFARAGRSTLVQDIPAAQYPTPARRPANSRLDCSSTTRTFGLSRPDWRAALDDVLKEIAR